MMLTLSFTVQSLIVLKDRKGTVFTTTIEKESNDGRIFTAEDGLQFAIGVVDYDTDADDYGDVLGRDFEDYIALSVWMIYYAEDDTEVPDWFEIETHRCTDEELGLDTSSDSSPTKFYPHTASSLSAVKGRSHVFHCFD